MLGKVQNFGGSGLLPVYVLCRDIIDSQLSDVSSTVRDEEQSHGSLYLGT